MSSIKELTERLRLRTKTESSKYDSKTASDLKAAAEAAFTDELLPRVFQNILSKAQREIVDTMSDIMDGKFPNKNVEYSVMRYKPLRVTDEDFLEALSYPYSDWVTTVKLGK